MGMVTELMEAEYGNEANLWVSCDVVVGDELPRRPRRPRGGIQGDLRKLMRRNCEEQSLRTVGTHSNKPSNKYYIKGKEGEREQDLLWRARCHGVLEQKSSTK